MHLSTITNTENKLLMYPFHSTPHRYPSAPPTIIRKPCVPEAALQNTRVYIGMSELGKEPFKWGPPK